MLGLTSSIVTELPEARQAEGVTAAKAEQIVLDHALETRQQALALQEGLTDRMILPVALSVDVEAEDDEGSRYVWVVYTDNPDSSLQHASDLPYLAHYVTLAGEYLYSLPTIIPGDEASTSGFDAGYVFEFMEPADYTGYVDISTGEEMEISVTVMRDRRTGMYYLGNLERRIVVGDCWEFLYNGGRVVLESSPDNLEWDQVGLLTFYNYCRAYDYYKEIGWIGGDGLGTPILVLNNYCDVDHKPVNNAAYVGNYLGWQLFLASQANDYSQCLDVLAHEYTHCVTGSVMTYNAYMNDYGAINEAISDIQGNTCQLLMDGAEATPWVLGDKSLESVRSMSEPHSYQQPEFTWDIYYTPNALTPTALNDLGGVHTNSSLLNSLAWRLYEKGGMTLEEGRAFWFTVDCAIVPGTDYPQLAELLPWALRATGLDQYETELRRSLDAIRLGMKAVPDFFDDDRALLEAEPGEAEETQSEEENKGLLETFLDALLDIDEAEILPEEETAVEDEAKTDMLDGIRDEIVDWARDLFGKTLYVATTHAGQDGRTMRIVSKPGYALPILIHGVYNEAADDLDNVHALVYIGDRWIDLSVIFQEPAEGEEIKLGEDLEAVINYWADNIFSVHGYHDVLDLIFFRIQGGMNNDLPSASLESASPQSIEIGGLEIDTEVQPRKSRPKLNDAQDAALAIGLILA